MAIYNVLTAVVALIDADSEQAAIREHAAQLRLSGHDPYEGDPYEGGSARAFLSESQEATCRHCGQRIQPVSVADLRLPPTVGTAEAAEALRADVRAAVGELAWEVVGTRRDTCASASLWHEPV